jgi:hypothetical protein
VRAHTTQVPDPPRARTLIVTAVAGVAAGVAIFFLVLALSGPRSARQAAGATFKVGSAKSLAQTVEHQGPLLFQDLLNRSRDIFVQHLGGGSWRAFEAHAPGTPRRCTLAWRAPTRDFVDPCDGRIFPADGTGLTSYPTRVTKNGLLVVDLSTPPPITSP